MEKALDLIGNVEDMRKWLLSEFDKDYLDSLAEEEINILCLKQAICCIVKSEEFWRFDEGYEKLLLDIATELHRCAE